MLTQEKWDRQGVQRGLGEALHYGSGAGSLGCSLTDCSWPIRTLFKSRGGDEQGKDEGRNSQDVRATQRPSVAAWCVTMDRSRGASFWSLWDFIFWAPPCMKPSWQCDFLFIFARNLSSTFQEPLPWKAVFSVLMYIRHCTVLPGTVSEVRNGNASLNIGEANLQGFVLRQHKL